MQTASKSKNSKPGSKKVFTASNTETGVAGILDAARGRADSIEVSNEERYQLIAKTAYFRAEQRNFAPGYELEDWLHAEAEIERKLSQSGRSDLIKNA
jgi:hypothetical protein